MAKLNFKYSTMNAGKTLDLIRTVHNYDENGYKVLVLKPKIDTKGEDYIVSRVGVSRKVDYLIDKEDSIIDLSIKINEDLLMNYYFFKLSNSAVYYDICPYHYMLRKGSAATSKVNENKLYDPIRVQKLILVDVGNNELLSNIIIGRLARFYISGASMNNPEKKPFIDEYIKMCRRELTKLRSRYLCGSRSRFDKIKFRLCCFSPALYRCFHKMFAIAKGTDKKYEVR